MFCEQCKSDISSVPPGPAPAPTPPPTPMPESIPPAPIMSDAPVMAAVVEEAPAVAVVVPEAPPAAAVVVEAPPPAAVVEVPAAAVVVEAPPAPPAEPAAAAPAPAKPAAASGTPIPAGATVKLVVQRGLKIGEEYTLFAGENFVGRADEKPVDVDLTFQEPEDRVWCSRQHALLVYDDATGTLTVEDLNSSNGTFVNRERVYPGQPRQLYVGNTVQIGTVHMRVKA